MAAKNQAAALKLTLAYEGGYVNHPKDPGGPTNKGITQNVYDAYRRSLGQAIRSVELITNAEVTAIYDQQYWDRLKGDKLPSGVDYAMFDYAVNSGVARAVKDVQRTINSNANRYGVSGQLAVDGNMGMTTIAAICAAANADEQGLIRDYCDRRLSFLKSLRTWSTFGKGWKRRVVGNVDGAQDTDVGVVDYAVKMARGDLTYPMKKGALPVEIGTRDGEAAGKGFESDKAALKDPTGLGSAIAGSGISGQTLMSTAVEQVQPHFQDTMFGKVAIVIFALLMVGGIGLIMWNFFHKHNEMSSSD